MIVSPSRPKILAVRLSSLGDVILTTPALALLKQKFPEGRLVVLVKKNFAPVFDGNPHVDDVWRFEDGGFWGTAARIRREKFDIYADFHDNLRSRIWGFFSGAKIPLRYDKRMWERRKLVWFKSPSARLNSGVSLRYAESLSPLGVSPDGTTPRIYVDEKSISLWRKDLGEGPFVGLAPGALHAAKKWPAEKFAAAGDALARRLSDCNGREAGILIFGSSADEESARAVLSNIKSRVRSLAGRTSLPDLFSAVSLCSLFISNDSGAMHAAAALGVPTAAVFGPTVEDFGFFPVGENAVVVEVNNLACRPCSLHGGEICPLRHFKCMSEISVEDVTEAAWGLYLREVKSR